jgi:GNAT superfamily N-acetyltransferase
MQFRLATIEDVPVITKMRIRFLKEIEDRVENLSEERLEKTLYEYFTRHLASGDFICWLAVDHTIVVATGGICFNLYPPSFSALTEMRAYIMNVYVLPDYRGGGIGSNIFGRLMQEAHNRHACVVSLHTTEMGLEMYKRFGFKEMLS